MKELFATIVNRLFNKILELWSTSESRSSELTLLFIAILLLLCTSVAWLGAVPTFIDGHDIFFFLENGWRTLQNLRPHVDFWSPWGPLTFLIQALGLQLAHYSPNGVAYGSAIVALVAGLWTYQLGRARLAPVPRALLGLYAAVLASSQKVRWHTDKQGFWRTPAAPKSAGLRYHALRLAPDTVK